MAKSKKKQGELDFGTISANDAIEVAKDAGRLKKKDVAAFFEKLKGNIPYDDYYEHPDGIVEGLCTPEGLCDLCKQGCETPLLMGCGTQKAKIMIVGEAPGGHEDEQSQMPFTGSSGQLLRNILAEAGVRNMEDIYFTNIVRCRPPQNATPTVKQCKACSPFMRTEIAYVKPNMVLLLGNTPLRAFYGKTGITSMRGIEFYSDIYNIKCIASFHPASILYGNTENERCLIRDVRKALRAAETPELTPFDEPKIEFITSIKKLRGLKKTLLQSEEFAFDLETSGFKPFVNDAHILLLAFSWGPDNAAIVPLDHPQNDWDEEEWEEVVDILEEIFGSPVPKIAYNGKFDVKWLRQVLDINVRNFNFDPMLAHYAVYEFKGTHGLEQVAADYLGFPNYKAVIGDIFAEMPKEKKARKYFGDIPLKVLGKYAGLDAVATFRLKDVLFKEMAKHGVKNVFNNILMPASRVLIEVELMGVRVDMEYLNEAEIELDEKIEDIERQLWDYDSVCKLHEEFEDEAELLSQGKGRVVAPKKMNFDSDHQVRRILFDHEELEPIKWTKTGAYPSVDKDVLEALARKNDIAAKFKERNHLATLQGGFVRGLRKWLIGDKIYPSYLIHGTVTGRLSCTEPNFQQVPREDWVKKLYVGSGKKDLFLEVDYSQMELRVVASLSGDKTMKGMFQRGEDIHTGMACKINNLPPEKITKQLRFDAKTMNFAILYGRGAHSIAEDLNITTEEAQELVDNYFEEVPGVYRWIKKAQKQARREGYVKTAFGRIRHLPEVSSSEKAKVAGALREAVNTKIQSPASDVTLLAMIKLYDALIEAGFESRPIGFVHDSIVMTVVPKERKRVPKLVKRVMEGMKYPWLTIPLVAEVKMGKSWGEAKELEF